MSSKLPISVVMVTFNTGEVLQQAIDGVLANPIAELILVNNGNPETQFQPIRERVRDDLRVNIIEGQGNVGYSRACNLGVKHVTQSHLLFLNPDAIVDSDTITRLYDAHEQQPVPVISGAWVVEEDSQHDLQVQRGTLRNQLTPLSLFIEALKLNRRWAVFNRWSLNRLDNIERHQPLRVSAMNGACLLMRQSVFDALNGFDEGYFLHFEDLDLFKRAEKMALILHPSIAVRHAKSSSDVAKSELHEHKFASFCRYFAKHYPLFWYSPLGWSVRLMFKLRKRQLFS